MVQKVAETSLEQTRASLANWKTLCQPSSKWVPFSNQRKLKQQKERGGLRLPSAVAKIQWTSSPIAPSAIKL